MTGGTIEKQGFLCVLCSLSDIKAKKGDAKMEMVESPLEEQRIKRRQSSQH